VPKDCEEDDPPAVEPPVLISWDPVTLSHPEIGRTDEPVEVLKYQLVVEREDPGLLAYSLFAVLTTLTVLAIPRGPRASGDRSGYWRVAEQCRGGTDRRQSWLRRGLPDARGGRPDRVRRHSGGHA
jgi:hypothetical protein